MSRPSPDADLFGEFAPENMPPWNFPGAVELDYDSAVRATPRNQNYTVSPRHWYIGAWIVCRDCEKEFLFSAGEQRTWYEEYKFWIDSFPDRCKECRPKYKAAANALNSHAMLHWHGERRDDPKWCARVKELESEIAEIYGFLPERVGHLTQKRRAAYILDSIRAAGASNDNAWLEKGMALGHEVGFPDEAVPLLAELLPARWHEQHEDIARLCQESRDPRAVPALIATLGMRLDYLDYNDSTALGRKCVWALFEIGTPEAVARIEEAANDPRPEVRATATKRLADLRGER